MPAPVAANGSGVGDFEVAQLAEGEAAQHRTVESGEAQIFLGKETAADRRESSPPTSELSTRKMNPQAPGWNKRSVVSNLHSIRDSVV